MIFNISFLEIDFKKENGYKKSVEYSKKYKLSNNYKKNKRIIKRIDKRLMNIRDDCHDKIINDKYINNSNLINLFVNLSFIT